MAPALLPDDVDPVLEMPVGVTPTDTVLVPPEGSAV